MNKLAFNNLWTIGKSVLQSCKQMQDLMIEMHKI